MAMEKTSSRVAMALMCGLAICCAVMYVTADGESALESDAAGSVYGIGGPASVDSEDVEKAGMVITNTPDGRMRLTKYLANVEAEISAEEAARKADVLAVQQQMARNFAFNKQARAKLQKFLLAKMAENAKKARDDLAAGMTDVQARFAHAEDVQNKRNNANIAESARLRKTIQQNKEIAKRQLDGAVRKQNAAMEALAAATNERIDQTNKHASQNSALIDANAKKAQAALQAAVEKFDGKADAAASNAKAGRDKLGQQLADQDKSIRSWANNKLKTVMAKTAAQFSRVRAKMAEDRANADFALKQASTRMTASMDAFEALNDKNFASNVADIKAAKAEAEAAVQKAESSFKVGLVKLKSTVTEQVAKTNARMATLSNVVEKNKVAQAKINSNVEAEQKRMVKLGQDRFDEHAKKDKELKGLIDANKHATDARLKAMTDHFTMALKAVRATMTKNRAHATHMLAKKSAELYSAIAKSEQAQLDTNGELKTQTRRAALEIQDSLKEAKDDFAERLGALHTTVDKNSKKFEGKINKLSGVVAADAIKSEDGRKQLKTLMESNKSELKSAVADAVRTGENRMKKAEDHLVSLNEKTKAALNMKITTEIAALEKRANDQIEGLRLGSKENRAMMKKQLLFAVRSMAKEAKENLDAAVKVATTEFANENTRQSDITKASAEERATIANNIEIADANAKEQLNDAVATMQKSLWALKSQTAEKIKATNVRVDAYAAQLAKESADVTEMMNTQMTTLTQGIDAQKDQAATDINAADQASISGFTSVMQKVEDQLAAAQKASDEKFGKFNRDMASQRSDLDKDLGDAVLTINDSIAKQAALADSRFSKTVKDITAARAEATEQVRVAREDFATSLATVTSSIKAMDSQITGQVQVIATEVISHKAAQTTVNVHVKAEIARVEKLMNDQVTKNVNARGVIRKIMNENKAAAAEEVVALDQLFKGKIASIRSNAADNALAAKQDLTAKTGTMYEAMADAQRDQIAANEDAAAKINTYSTESLAAIAASKADFESRLDTLTNVVASNHKSVEHQFEVLTGVLRGEKQAAEHDRGLIQKQNNAMAADMHKAIVVAITEGEAKAKAVADRSRGHLDAAQKSMLVEITNKVEEAADATFAAIQGNHKEVANNYLSLKAYAITAADAVLAYVGKGQGKNLSSLGALLKNIAADKDIKTESAEGVLPANGDDEMSGLFTGRKVTVDTSVTKVNGLVKEYTTAVNLVRSQYPQGLGKYLLEKLEDSMRGDGKGVLQVDKIDNKSGNWVFINGHLVGLSNKMNDFEGLAVRMAHYEEQLAKLTAGLSSVVAPNPKPVYVTGGEWPGN